VNRGSQKRLGVGIKCHIPSVASASLWDQERAGDCAFLVCLAVSGRTSSFSGQTVAFAGPWCFKAYNTLRGEKDCDRWYGSTLNSRLIEGNVLDRGIAISVDRFVQHLAPTRWEGAKEY
jgi:hypothetical protein